MSASNENLSNEKVAAVNSPNEEQSSYLGWFQSAISQSSEIWGQIKHDISEVAQTVMSNEPLAAARGTATSVIRNFTHAVQSLQHEGGTAEPLPSDQVDEQVIVETNTVEIDVDAIKSTLTGMVCALERGLNEIAGGPIINFGLSTPIGRTTDNREACVEVIRADPVTFEQLPPVIMGVLPYVAWREAYFNPETCSPRPEMPVFDGLDPQPSVAPKRGDQFSNQSIPPPPARVLDESPIVRKHLLRLVDPEGCEEPAKEEGSPTAKEGPSRRKEGGLTEADFWSRYYYRVWCWDVLELRRRKLATVEQHANVEMKENKSEANKCEQEPPAPMHQRPSPPKQSAGVISNLSSPCSSSIIVLNINDGEHEEAENLEETLLDHTSSNEEDAIELTVDDLRKAAIDRDLKDDDASEGSDWETWTGSLQEAQCAKSTNVHNS